MKTLKNNLNAAMAKVYIRAARMKETLKDESGEFVWNESTRAVIILVVAGVVLAFLIPWVKDTLFPTLGSKLMAFFN